MNSSENPAAELWHTDHETGRDYFIESGPLLTLHAKAMDMVAHGRDAWTCPPALSARVEAACAAE